MQKITDNPLKTCIFCNGQVKKLVSNCSFQLKGTGWYATDYAQKSSSSEGKKKPKKKDSTEKPNATSTEKQASQETAVNQHATAAN
jgi:predicted nucleic acid-binding Zn ribbon protein